MLIEFLFIYYVLATVQRPTITQKPNANAENSLALSPPTTGGGAKKGRYFVHMCV